VQYQLPILASQVSYPILETQLRGVCSGMNRHSSSSERTGRLGWSQMRQLQRDRSGRRSCETRRRMLRLNCLSHSSDCAGSSDGCL